MANNSCLQKGRKAKYGRNAGTQGKQRTTKRSFFSYIIIKSKKKEGGAAAKRRQCNRNRQQGETEMLKSCFSSTFSPCELSSNGFILSSCPTEEEEVAIHLSREMAKRSYSVGTVEVSRVRPRNASKFHSG